jgi:hypothetical protein
MARTVFFEELKGSYFLPVKCYSLLGYRIIFKSSHKSCDGADWIEKLKRLGKIEQIEFSIPFYYGQEPSTDKAIEYVKGAGQRHLRNRGIDHMVDVYESSDVKLAYEKVLIEIFSHYFYRLGLLDRLAAEGIEAPIFVAKDNDLGNADWNAAWCCWFCEKLKTYDGALGVGKLYLPLWLRVKLFVYQAKKHVNIWARMAYDLFKGVRDSARYSPIQDSPRGNEHDFDLGIFVVAPERELRGGNRSIGFFTRHPALDGVRSLYIPKGQLDAEIIKRIEDRGLDVAKWPWEIGFADLSRLFLCRGFLFSFFSSYWVLFVSRYLTQAHIRWSSFTRHYRVAAIVTYADFAFDHIGRNILLKRNGIETWYYNDSINMGKWASYPEYETPLCHPFWCHLFYDHLVTSNDRIARYFQAHPNQMQNYDVVGSLWARDLIALRQDAEQSSYWEILCDNGYRQGMQLIVLFDSWFHPDGMNTLDDMVRFTDHFTRLLDDGHDDLFVVLKEKVPQKTAYSFFSSRDCDQVYASHRRLAEHARGCVLDSSHDVSGIAALADIVVSFPFTSATYECWCANIKATYYDPSNKLRGSYYDQFPAMLLHGYSDLVEQIGALLSESDSQFFARLHSDKMHDQELNLQPNGLERFCRLLADTVRERSSGQ